MRRFTLVLAFLVGTGSAMYRKAPREPRPLFSVVVATRELPIGVPIAIDDVAVLQVPAAMIPPEVTFSSTEDVIGHTPTERILANEMFRTERLARADAGVGLNAIITPGKRAMSITVALGSVAGLAPDNFVDVIVADGTNARTVATQLRVLAVRGGTPSAMTVELTLDEAEALALGLARGTLFAATRSDLEIVRVFPPPARSGCEMRIDPSPQGPPHMEFPPGKKRLSDGAIVPAWQQ